MEERRSSRLLMVLAFVAFISLGLPDAVLGVAWPSVRAAFDQPLSKLGVLSLSGMAGYLTSSFFAGQIVRGIGVGRLLVSSSALVTVSLVGYATSPLWSGMIGMAVLGGLGAGAIDAGINAFAAAKFTPRVVNWLHAFYGVGATSGPFLMTAVLTAGFHWRVGYAILAVVLGVLTGLFVMTVRLWTIGQSAKTGEAAAVATLSATLTRPIVWIHALLFFIYCGIESTAGQLLYSVFTEARGISVAVAGSTIGGYWAALTFGRIVFGQVASRVTPRSVLRIGTILAPTAALLIWWHPTRAIELGGTLLLGFALAPIFPTLISVTPRRVGAAFAPHAVGFQVALASIGISAAPAVVAVLTKRYGLDVVGQYLMLATVTLLVLHEAVMRLTERETSRALAAAAPLA